MTPFSFMLDRTVTVQRRTVSKDSVGGDTYTWATLYSGQRAARWDSGGNGNQTVLLRTDGVVNYQFAFETDLGLRHGDRILDGGEYFQVVGVAVGYANAGIAQGPYIVNTELRQN